MDSYEQWARSFSMEWLNELLNSIEKNCSQEDWASLLEPCGVCHYKFLEPMLEKYIGDIQGFIDFMSREHGQIIKYDENTNTILVDENKSYCVCPITQSMDGKQISAVLCHCSSALTERMISKITGKEVKSRVVSSVLRGDKTCVYEIKILN